MKRSMEYKETPVLHNFPALSKETSFTAKLEKRNIFSASLASLIENTPKLKISEVLVISVEV
tara:strand:+ start:202 stop:387 length:186 start_codon:yes stop_codon:yes gene_type:complete